MSQQKRRQQRPTPPHDTTDLMLADVPVKISFVHNNKTLKEYDEVIDIEFTPNTAEGRTNMRRFILLKEQKGLSTESALFTLASDAIGEHAQQLVTKLNTTKLFRPATQQEIHVHVKRNGTITYRRPLPQGA
jgi:hypothetical protein